MSTIARRTLATLAATAVAAGILVSATGAAMAEPIGGAKLFGSGIIVDPGPQATPLPEIPATTWVLADLDTGAILAARGPHVQRPPASTLKTLTALTLIPRLDPDTAYTVSYDDIAIEGSRVGLVEGGEYTVSDLLYGLMLQSGNDAAAALANANGGLELTLAQMNEEAARLQAFDTVAKTPSGLPAVGQVSSAYDLALIAREGLSRGDFSAYVSRRQIDDYPGFMPTEPGGARDTFTIANQNPLINPTDGREPYEGALGVKTGWTTEAGKTFVGAAEQGGVRLVVVLMNFAIPTYDAAAPLLDWGFANINAVTPVGYLVDPVRPAIDEPVPVTPESAESGDGAAVPAGQVATDSAGGTQAAVATTGAAAIAGNGWAWGLLAAMVLGVILIVSGLRALREPPARRARSRRPLAPPTDDEESSGGSPVYAGSGTNPTRS